MISAILSIFATFWDFKPNFAQGRPQMKVISVIYMSICNFWCMTRGGSWHLNFQLQKVDWEPSGRQNWGKMMEFWKILYIHFIRDPKGTTYVRFILKIESDAKMACTNDIYTLNESIGIRIRIFWRSTPYCTHLS